MAPDTAFIQLDDLNAEKLAPLAPAVFLTLETSPGNFQAWVALKGVEDPDFARRLRKGTGADATASGATRVAGSLNFKDKYAPVFPRVAIRHAQAGRMARAAELQSLGLVAEPETVAAVSRISPARARPATAAANGRATSVAWTARPSTARKPAPISAARTSYGA